MCCPEELARAIEEAHYRNQQGAYFSGMKAWEGAVLLYTDIIEDCFWNYAARIDTAEDKIDKLLEDIVGFYRSIDRAPCVYITAFCKPGNLAERLAAIGFKSGFKDTWMVHEKPPPTIATPEGTKLTRVEHKQDMELFVGVFYEAYGGATEDEPYGELPQTYGEALRRSYDSPSGEAVAIHYLCYVDDKPVGIGTLISSGGFGGIYNVGTSPRYRKRGVGSAISLQAIHDSEEQGNSITYLMTESGSYVEAFYKRLGFSTKFVGEGFVLSD